MDVVIALGGFGTRLHSITNNRLPKPMVDVHGDPFLKHLLQYINETLKPKRFVFLTGHLTEKIEEYFRVEFAGIPILYSVEDSPLGTGGALKAAVKFLNLSDILFINGDTIHEINYGDMLEVYDSKHRKEKEILISCKYMSDVSRYGALSLNGQKVISFIEKSSFLEDGFIFTGSALFNASSLLSHTANKFDLSKEFFARKTSHGGVYSFASDGYFVDIGVPEDYFTFVNLKEGLE